MDLVVAAPEREMPGCMPEIKRLRKPLTVLGRGVRLRSLSVLRGRKSRGSRAEKKGRRGGRQSDLGEHHLVSCLCCCSRRLGVCQENLDASQRNECEIPNAEN
jgi:hypothetical protein